MQITKKLIPFLFFTFSASLYAGYFNKSLLWDQEGSSHRLLNTCVLRMNYGNGDSNLLATSDEYYNLGLSLEEEDLLYGSMVKDFTKDRESDDDAPISNKLLNLVNQALNKSFRKETTFVHFTEIKDCTPSDIEEMDVILMNRKPKISMIALAYASNTGDPKKMKPFLYEIGNPELAERMRYKINFINLQANHFDQTGRLSDQAIARSIIHEFGHVAGLMHDFPTMNEDTNEFVNIYPYWSELEANSKKYASTVKDFSQRCENFPESKLTKLDSLFGNNSSEYKEIWKHHGYPIQELEYLWSLKDSNYDSISNERYEHGLKYKHENISEGGGSSLFSTMGYSFLHFTKSEDVWKKGTFSSSSLGKVQQLCDQYKNLPLCNEKILRTLNGDYLDPEIGMLRPADIETLAEAYGIRLSQSLNKHMSDNYVTDSVFLKALADSMKIIQCSETEIKEEYLIYK